MFLSTLFSRKAAACFKNSTYAIGIEETWAYGCAPVLEPQAPPIQKNLLFTKIELKYLHHTLTRKGNSESRDVAPTSWEMMPLFIC